MPNKSTTKEKFLAIFSCIILFAFVAILFVYIGLYNKDRTNALRAEVRAIKQTEKIERQINSLKSVGFVKEEVTARSFLSAIITDQSLSPSGPRILLAKNIEESLPIASITKLMTAIIVLENLDLNSALLATKEYVGGDGTFNTVEIGKVYTVKELLYNTLIASDNDSAQLLSSALGVPNFIRLMNSKALILGLENTNFVNVTGLDPLEDNPNKSVNISSASDILSLLTYIKKERSGIFEISQIVEHNFCSLDKICKPITSTNKLLSEDNFKFPIIGGKTGKTDVAGQNLALIMEPFDGIFLVNIVLGSADNFADTRNIINHIEIKK